MKATAYITIDTGDWVAFYVDGVSVHQGHDLPTDTLFGLLQEHGLQDGPVHVRRGEYDSTEDPDLGEFGNHFPDTLAELPEHRIRWE